MNQNHNFFSRALAAAHGHAVSYLHALDQSPVAAPADLATLRQRLNKPLTDESVAPDQVIDKLVRDVDGGTIDRAIRLLGFGRQHLVCLPSDSLGRLSVEALSDALAADPEASTIVALQAGDVNTGAFDDFETIVPLAHKYGAWVHVDGAFG